MKPSFLVETHPDPNGHLVRVLLRIEGEVHGDDRRVPLNLSLVLDRSGSMGGGKLEAVKRAARDLIRRLHPSDHVSVVAFDDEVQTVAYPGTAAEQGGIVGALMAIETGGCTNLSGGWLQGRALIQAHYDAEGVNRVILLTDGLANQGITDHPTLKQLCATALGAGVSTTTVGVGADYDEELLAGMAEAGGGSMYYIEQLDKAGGVFEEELEGLLSIAAQNLTVTLRAREGVAVAGVHNSYPSRCGSDGAPTLAVGDLYPREPLEVLADFVVSAGRVAAAASGETQVPVADLVVEADVWGPGGALERKAIVLPVTFAPAAGTVIHPEVQKAFALLAAARARDVAIELGDRGDVYGAAAALRHAVVAMAPFAADDEAVAAEAGDLEQMAAGLMVREAMSAADRKYMYTKARMNSRSRRSAGDKLTRD